MVVCFIGEQIDAHGNKYPVGPLFPDSIYMTTLPYAADLAGLSSYENPQASMITHYVGKPGNATIKKLTGEPYLTKHMTTQAFVLFLAEHGVVRGPDKMWYKMVPGVPDFTYETGGLL